MDNRARTRYVADEDIVPASDPSPSQTDLADQRIATCDNARAPELNLNGLGLQELPPSVRSLTWLQTLRFQNNRMRELPEWIDALADLRELDLRGTPTEVFPSSFRRLTQLKLLLIDSGNVSALGDTVQHLTSLRTLGLTRLGLAEVPEWIHHLHNLEDLYLFHNSFTSLPEWLGHLPRLRLLSVRNNRLGTLPESLQMLESLNELQIEGNPNLRLPEEITESRNARRILDYYHRTAAPGTGKPLNEFKLILVGRGGAGKTTAVERLVTGRFRANTTRTPGINITKWALKIGGTDVRAHIWDFGGQEIMHGTHRFFIPMLS